MRKKSWLRQASRDRRPRRTQSSISASYSKHGKGDGGRNAREEKVRGTKIHTGKQERVENSEKSRDGKQGGRERGEKRC